MRNKDMIEVETRKKDHLKWLRLVSKVLKISEPGHFVAIGPGIPVCVGDKHFISRMVLRACK